MSKNTRLENAFGDMMDSHDSEDGNTWYTVREEYSTTTYYSLDKVIKHIAEDIYTEGKGFKPSKDLKVTQHVTNVTEVDIFKKYKQTIKASYDLIVEEEREEEDRFDELEERYKNGDIDEWTMEEVKYLFPRMFEKYIQDSLVTRNGKIDFENLPRVIEDFNRGRF